MRNSILITTLLLTSSCATYQFGEPKLNIKKAPLESKVQEERNFNAINKTREEPELEEIGFQIEKEHQTYQVLWEGQKPSNILKHIHFPSKKIKLNIDEVDIKSFVDLVFGKVLKLNYVIDPSVSKAKSKVSLHMEEETKLKDFFILALNILDKYGIEVTYNDNQNVFTVKYDPKAKTRNFPVIYGKEIPPKYQGEERILVIVPVKYVSPNTIYKFLTKYLVPPDSLIAPIAESKALIVMGPVISCSKVLKIINFFDSNKFKDKKFFLMRLKYTSPSTFTEKLAPMLKAMGLKASTQRFKGDEDVILIPIDSTNSIFISLKSRSTLSIITKLKSEFDSPSTLETTAGFFIFKPQNRSAEELYNIIKDLLKAKKDQTKSTKVILDKFRNQIIFKTNAQEFKEIQKLLSKLDTLPKQVYVEVTIAEITLKDQLQYGLEWYLQHTGELNGQLQTFGGLGIGTSGLSYSLVSSSEKFKLLLNMFAKKDLVRILSSPQLVVLNGKSATINVGTEVPVISSEVSAKDVTTNTQEPSILRNIEYRKTGVQLTIKPIINSSGVVELEISQQVSDAQTNNLSGIDSPLILNRSIKTTVVVSSGQSVVLGGLISHNYSRTSNKVPFFGDLPIIGNAFKTESYGSGKTELIVVITPRIIDNSKSFDILSSELIKKLSLD